MSSKFPNRAASPNRRSQTPHPGFGAGRPVQPDYLMRRLDRIGIRFFGQISWHFIKSMNYAFWAAMLLYTAIFIFSVSWLYAGICLLGVVMMFRGMTNNIFQIMDIVQRSERLALEATTIAHEAMVAAEATAQQNAALLRRCRKRAADGASGGFSSPSVNFTRIPFKGKVH